MEGSWRTGIAQVVALWLANQQDDLHLRPV